MNSFYGDIKQAIVDSEEAGLIVATDQQHSFPKNSESLYETNDADWIGLPIYCKPSHLYHLSANNMLRPISSFSELSP